VNRTALFALLPLLLAACVAPGPDADPVSEAASPIIGGTLDTADPAVVLLYSYPSDESSLYTCTAAVIAPTVLLTAAHCVDDENHPGFIYGVFAEPDASSYGDIKALKPHLLSVKSVHAHPDYDTAPPFHADIAVVILDQPISAAPLPINRTAPSSSLVGGPARMVGYGQVVVGQYNVTKHEAPTVVASIGPVDTIIVGDSVRRSCIGDSGGPALVTIGGVETIVGVDSYTETSGCKEPANYRRTDVFTSFIDQYAPPPPPPGDGGIGGAGGSGGVGATSTSATSSGAGVGGGGVAATTSTSTSTGGDETSSGGCALQGNPGGDLGTSAAALLAAAALWRRRRATKRA
jgi:secreted trypsin-like serine protease